jgi:PAN domain/PAN-like domain
MNTISDNLLNSSNFVNMNENKYTNYTDNNVPSLYQGQSFTSYQDKIKNKYTPFKEHFSNIDDNLPRRLETVGLNQTYDKTLNKYDENIAKYDGLAIEMQRISNDYINRTNPKNIFLNKIIRFNTGQLCYVTNQGVAKYIPNPTILKSISSKNGCPDTSNGYVDINIPWMEDYKIQGTQLPTNPPLIMGKNMQLNESCGYQGASVFVNTMIGNDPSQSYVGCYEDTINNPTMAFIGGAPPANGDALGSYNLEQCKNAAIREGKQYYALQNVNPNTNLGYCAVGNDLNQIKVNGDSYILKPLWSSNTKGSQATHAKLTTNGTLTIRDDLNNVFFTSPNGSNCAQKYSISYNEDAPGNDIGFYTNINANDCKTKCDNQPQCTGFAFDTRTRNRCWTKAGKLTNVNKNDQRAMNRKTVETENCEYFLLLQNDGNMSIYRGVPNANNNVLIWGSDTFGYQSKQNPKYVSSKCKFGVPFLKTNQIIYKGEWLSSSDGSLLLKMENDGNLVLYAFVTNCAKKRTDNKDLYYGGNLANAVYDLGKESVGVRSNMGKLAFIDADSQLYPYPSSNITNSNTYSSIIDNTNIDGNDIPGAAVTNVSINKCIEVCNKYDNCNAFVYDTNGPNAVCLPKNVNQNDLYSTSKFKPSNNSYLYIRDKKPLNIPTGVSDKVFNVNSLAYNNYYNTGKIPESGGLANFIGPQKSKLSSLNKNIDLLSNELASNVDAIETRVLKPIEGFEGSRLFYDNIRESEQNIQKSKQIEKIMPNIDNMLNDSNIVTLQENYSYMLWSILALGTVILAVKLKNQ